MDIDTLIASVRERMGELIQKPKMTEKLLQKPPFRFLHDTVTAVTNTTGFGEGLYEGMYLYLHTHVSEYVLLSHFKSRINCKIMKDLLIRFS
jgi:hypothetical protein